MHNVTRLLFLTVFAACAHQPCLILPGAPRNDAIAVTLAQAPLAAGENFKAVPLERGEHASISVVQIRDREPPHIHKQYDLTVTLVRGHGTLHLGDAAVAMRAGDTTFIKRGERHFFVNDGREPAVSVVSFAPPFDGPDQQPAP